MSLAQELGRNLGFVLEAAGPQVEAQHDLRRHELVAGLHIGDMRTVEQVGHKGEKVVAQSGERLLLGEIAHAVNYLRLAVCDITPGYGARLGYLENLYPFNGVSSIGEEISQLIKKFGGNAKKDMNGKQQLIRGATAEIVLIAVIRQLMTIIVSKR